MRRSRVAAIQVESLDGRPDHNLAHAEPFVAEAAARGAELVVCPEFLATGYSYSEAIWRAGEPLDGRTERWLARLARAHHIHLGAGFLEADGDEFHNTFSLFDPEGCLVGRVRKGSLPFYEGFYFAPCPRPKTLETRLGRIAVGICNDNQTAAFLREVLATRPDLIIMPHSAPTPELPLLGATFRRHYEDRLGGVAARYARALGVPVVMANKISTARRETPLPLLPGVRLRWRFRGLSTVCDGSGAVLGRLEEIEGALVADVALDPSRKRRDAEPSGYWSFAPPVGRLVGAATMRAFEALGRWAYRRNARRREAARAVAEAAPRASSSAVVGESAEAPRVLRSRR